MNERKNKTTTAIASLVVVLALALGISFAYFMAQDSSEEQTVTTANLDIDYADGSPIANASGISPLIRETALPTQDETGKVTTVGKAVTKNFTIKNLGDKKMYVHLSLENMTLPDDLRRYDFVWSLYEVTDKTNNIEKNVSNGTFLIEGNSMDIAPYQVFEAPVTEDGVTTYDEKEYNLYIWIEETHLNQSVMMGEEFKATITATGEEYWTSPESDFTVSEAGVLTAYNGPGGDIIIPPVVNGVTVTEIGDSFHPGIYIDYGDGSSLPIEITRTNLLTSVVIPNTVTKIGLTSFMSNQLTSIFIPNSVTSIGDGGTFMYNKLSSLSIPNSVTSIGEEAFSGNQLTSVVIPNSVTSIGNSAFENNQLTSVTIPNSVTSIGSGAFSDNQLTTVVIPESVDTIEEYAFYTNKNLTEIIVLGKSEAPAWNNENRTGYFDGSGEDLFVFPWNYNGTTNVDVIYKP
ncbi:MAG: leucine-rich repeat domain-containing protein [Bacilli bacterium]|nr:leucine-rich repeat domain-containing protein [Bacilli bacterium]